MTAPTFDPEDPKLTAYALGELTDPVERAAVETLLQHSPAARTAMKEIQDITTALTAEYDQERHAPPEGILAEALPPNVVRLASRASVRRSWARPMLAAAAVLLLGGFLVCLSLPVLNSVQVKGSRRLAQGHVQPPPDEVGSKTSTSTPDPSVALKDESTKFAQTDAKLPEAAPASPQTPVDRRPEESAQSAKELAEKGLALNSVVDPTKAAQPGKDGLQSYTGQTAGASLSPLPVDKPTIGSSTVALGGAVAPANAKQGESSSYALTKTGREYDVNGGLSGPAAAPAESLSTDVQAQSAAPAKPLARGGTGQGLGATGNGGVRGVVSEKAAAQANYYAATRATAVPNLELSDGRRAKSAQVDMDASEAVAAAPASAAQAEISDKPGYPTQLQPSQTQTDFNTAAYDHLVENPFLAAKENPLSTFSIDVDTASYANVRRFLDGGSLPPPDAVRLEELINYFPYSDAPPAPESKEPFAIHLEAAACPWAPEHRLVRIGIKGREIAVDKRPASNLVFLLDVSGSMMPPERLPLIKAAMKLLVEQLTESDHVAIVTYAGNSGLVLPSTSGDHKDTILAALDHLEAGGSTNGASGIKLAYQVAKKGFLKGGTNRVILGTDGDFNVGVTSQGDLVRLIEEQAKSGVFLSALGVGTDNFKDSTMQKLADKGNGNYNYLDRLEEARKVLVEQMSGTLLTIAKDVKIQVEFNPAEVASYRLIGYEKRMLRKEDFNNDKIDAGEIGAGHNVTALYEVVPAGQPTPGEAPVLDALKYGANPAPVWKEERKADGTSAHELLTLKMRFKAPDADTSERTAEEVLVDKGAAGDYAKASPDFKFSAAVATFGLALRDSPYKGGSTLGAAVELAEEGKGTDPKGYRAGFIELARKAQALKDAAGK